jgi:hypothetical protein
MNMASLDNSPKIKVIIRKRPLSKKEMQAKELDIIEVLKQQSVIVREQKFNINHFNLGFLFLKY